MVHVGWWEGLRIHMASGRGWGSGQYTCRLVGGAEDTHGLMGGAEAVDGTQVWVGGRG